MTECYPIALQFPSVKRRKVEADFSGGHITGNGGIPLLSTVDRRLGLTRAVAGCLDDSRRQASCEHSLSDLLRQRVYALALGHEDLNDHGELRHDLALQTAALQAAPTVNFSLSMRGVFTLFALKHQMPIRRSDRSWYRTRTA